MKSVSCNTAPWRKSLLLKDAMVMQTLTIPTAAKSSPFPLWVKIQQDFCWFGMKQPSCLLTKCRVLGQKVPREAGPATHRPGLLLPKASLADIPPACSTSSPFATTSFSTSLNQAVRLTSQCPATSSHCLGSQSGQPEQLIHFPSAATFPSYRLKSISFLLCHVLGLWHTWVPPTLNSSSLCLYWSELPRVRHKKLLLNHAKYRNILDWHAEFLKLAGLGSPHQTLLLASINRHLHSEKLFTCSLRTISCTFGRASVLSLWTPPWCG